MSHIVRFGPFEADLDSGQLSRHETRIRLRHQSFQVLASLLAHPGEVVTREALREELWGNDVIVDFENNLNTAVGQLRQALCDSSDSPHFIETLPKRGYRFIAPVSHVPTVPSQPATTSRARLVVLPFLNLSGDPAQDYFSDAITEEIITALAGLAPEQLAVVARTTAMHYKASRKDVARIGRDLQVDYVVEGGATRSNDRVSINVQLIQTNDQTHLFAQKYYAPIRDLFNLHSSIAHDVVTRIPIAARVANIFARRTKSPTVDPAAYDEYIQGRYLVEKLTPHAMTTAKRHFESAIVLDPEFALAHIALADLYSLLGYVGYLCPRNAYLNGRTYAQRATELDDTLAESHVVLAEYHKQLDYNWPAAEYEMMRALQLNRSSSFVRLRRAAFLLMPLNRMEEAVAEVEYAVQLDPLSGLARGWLGIMLLFARDYDRAIKEARALLELEPTSPWPHFIIGVAYRQKYFEESVRGHVRTDFADQAIAGHQRAIELSPGADYFFGWLGLALGVCGRKDEARAVLDQLKRSERYVLPSAIAHVHLGLGDLDAVFHWFDRAVEERDQTMMPILSYAHFDPLRQDPRFKVLLRKMNLSS